MTGEVRPFEQGPIRPPSEAMSLLLRVIRNCTWNRCAFCPVYKGSKPSQRDVAEILADIDAMAAAADALGGPRACTEHMAQVLNSGRVPPEAYQVALFLRGGARNVFLQDADPCAVRPERLVAVLERLKERFPTVDRVTTYGRAATLARRSPADLEDLRAAGLTRVHIGLESGADEVLREMCKGATAGQLEEAGRRVLRAGLELCFYVMPGLGGRRWRTRHVEGTAAVLRAVASAAAPERPLVVRLRTAAVAPGTPLAEMERVGAFELPDDVEVAQEVRELLDLLSDAHLVLRSDHVLNLLPEVAGSLPADRDRLLALLDRYLGLPPRDRAEYALGARSGIYRRLSDLDDPARRAAFAAHVGVRTGADDEAVTREMLDVARKMRARFI